jgi:hypothetical protein
MKAPVGPRGTFTKADREEIKQSLAKIEVDLDTARLSAHFESSTAPHKGGRIYRYSSSTQPWISVGPEWLLSEALQRIAYFYTLPKAPAAKQRARQLKDLRVVFEKARRNLPSAEGRLYNYPDTPSDVTKDRALYDLMAWKIGELQEREARLKAIGSSSKYNRRTMLGDYCRELTRLWQACGDGKLHEESLRRFLLACSRAPFAKDMSTERLEQKIDNFLKNLPHSRKQ